MDTDTVDVAIVGGGMAGCVLALLLAQQMPSLRVVLLEQHPLQVVAEEQLLLPSFDARSTALALSSEYILAALGVWQSLAVHSAPIFQVHVSEKKRPHGMLMSARELGLPALGHVVENRLLGQVLLAALLREPRIRVQSPVAVARIQFMADLAQLTLGNGTRLQSRLVVVADGAQSALRQQLGIAVDCKPYDQHALVANVVTALPHAGIAYERFTDTGPVALLPLTESVLPDGSSCHRAALVWTVPDSDIDEVMALSDANLLARVQERIGRRCGPLLALGQRHAYPLSLVVAREQVRSRLVVLGSAAHHLHPVAGQGFNLILRDCQVLAESLLPVVTAGSDIGDIAHLRHYLERQSWDQQKTVTVSDWLPRLFTSRAALAGSLRTAALLGLDFLPGLRGWFAREATGL